MLRVLTLGLLASCTNGNDDGTGHTGDTEPEVVEVTDSWTQTLTSPVDILWVVDSGWTEALDTIDRDMLDKVFELLLIADPSWKMGIIESTNQGADFGVIDKQWSTWPGPDPFEAKTPEGPPRIRESIHMALELRRDHPQTEEFIRSDAHLYVVVLSNSVDESTEPTGTETGPTTAISQAAFDQWFADYTPSESKRLSVITDGAARNYWEDRLMGGGILVEIGAFRSAMETIVLDAINQRTTFTLTQVPAEPPELVTVTWREQVSEYAQGKDFTYDPVTNTIEFTKVIPPRDSIIAVTYLPAEPGAAPDPTTTASGTTTAE
jgi:hypothetical protein